MASFKINSVALTDFMGVKGTVEYTFDDIVRICGMNGTGKTTIATGIISCLCNKDYYGNANPSIRPTDGRECTPSVAINATFDDGSIAKIEKAQKEKKSKPDAEGIVKVTTTNVYTINDVPKTERDFNAYLLDKGVDTKDLISKMIPDLFLKSTDKKTTDALRSLLMGMVQDVTDKEIAVSLGEDATSVAKLLETYKADEIEAMTNATLRKIRENYGKDGEILRAKIEGLEKAKTGEDADKVRTDISEIEKEIERIESEIASKLHTEEIEKLTTEKEKLAIESREKKSAFRMEYSEKLNSLDREIKNTDIEISDTERTIERAKMSLSNATSELKEYESTLERLKKEEKEISEMSFKGKVAFDESEWVFNDSNEICKSCGQKLPEEKINELKLHLKEQRDKEYKKALEYFEKRKKEFEEKNALDKGIVARRIELVTLSIRGAMDSNVKNEVLRHTTEKTWGELTTKRDKLIAERKDLEENCPDYPDEIKEIDARIKEIFGEIINLKTIASSVDSLNLEKKAYEEKLKGMREHLIVVLNDEKIQDQIAGLYEKQTLYEQKKADMEKILHELDLVSRTKNRRYEKSINDKFSLVNWKLFDYLKNGKYVECCVPMYKDKALGVATNTALEVEMKLDIVNTIQRETGCCFPIIIDGAERLDSTTIKNLKTESQLITLCVTDDEHIVVKGEKRA